MKEKEQVRDLKSGGCNGGVGGVEGERGEGWR